jgi:hypothetical protein
VVELMKVKIEYYAMIVSRKLKIEKKIENISYGFILPRNTKKDLTKIFDVLYVEKLSLYYPILLE